jgi:predicted MFS family arabinose efflux permease
MTRDNKLLALALLLWGFGEGLFLYIEPLYLRELGADPVATGSALSIAALTGAFAHLPAGYLADHYGRKRVILGGWLMAVAAGLLMFAANGLTLFVIALALYSSTIFVVTPINAYVAEARGGQSLQRALTLVYSGFWAGTIFSPSLGGWMGQSFGLRYTFGAAFFLFTLSAVAIGCLKPQPITHAAHGEWRYRPLLRNRAFLGYLLVGFVALLAIQIGLPLMPTFAQEVRGFDVASVGLLGSFGSLGIVLTNAVMGHRAPRPGLLIALVIAAVCMAALLTLPGWPGLAVAYLLRAGYSLGHAMVSAQTGQLVGEAETGVAFGLSETVASAAMMVGPLVAGVLYAQSPTLPFQISLGVIALAIALAWWRAPRPAAAPEAVTLSALRDG